MIEPKEQIEVKPSQKDVKLIHEALQSIHGCIEKLQTQTKTILQNDRNAIWIELAKNLQSYKEELQYENEKKKENAHDIKKNEEDLARNLKIMTECAEKTDKEKQILLKKWDQLKIELKSQEDDHDMLMKQIIVFKKQESKLNEQHAELKQRVDELQA